MRVMLVLLAIEMVFAVHAAKTGRLYPWAYVILGIPLLGIIAYVVLELIPHWNRRPQDERARGPSAEPFDPLQRYSTLRRQLTMSDTIANRVAVAAECLRLGKFEEAKRHYDHVIAQPLGDEPSYMVGRARAEFGMGRPQNAIGTLDALRVFWPNYQSADAHLLYARALEEAGRETEALDEYEALSSHYPGAEARLRWGLLLGRLGRHDEAKALFADIVTSMQRAPTHVRRMQAEWVATAEAELRA